MSDHFNGLTPAEDERLTILAEECAEVIQAVCKIQRHGYESRNPLDVSAAPPTNRQTLEKELGHAIAALQLLFNAGELRRSEIYLSEGLKLETIRAWTHHQPTLDRPTPPPGTLKREGDAVGRPDATGKLWPPPVFDSPADSEPPMRPYYIVRNDADSVFVKEGEFFKQQGGLTEPWGRNWTLVHATSIRACPADRSVRVAAALTRQSAVNFAAPLVAVFGEKGPMNAPTPPDAAIFRGESAAELLPLAMIDPSGTNPRRTFDKDKLRELQDSIATAGVLQPVLVRPHPKNAARFELVVGERRFRAAKAAGLEKIPAVVRTLTDEQALEVQCIENLQREDVEPIEEAEGYERLIKAYKHTVEDLAHKLGKSKSYVYQRLKLCALTEKGREWMRKGVLTPAGALIIARMPVPSYQDEVLRDLTRYMDSDTLSPARIRNHVEREYMLILDGKGFPPTDATLIPAAGACGTCPKRTGNAPNLFGDIKNKDTCTDPKCFHAKREAHISRVRAEAQAKGQTVISGKKAKELMPYQYSHDIAGGYVRLDQVNHFDPKRRTFATALGKDAPPPTLIENPHTGELIPVALRKDIAPALKSKGIPIGPPRGDTSPGAEKQRAEERKRKLEATIRRQIFWHVRNQPATLSLEDLRLIARNFYCALFHEHRKLIDGHWAWKIGDAEIMKLDGDKIQRLLLDLALVGATSTQTSKAEIDQLLAVAKRHDVDHKAIRKQILDAAREKAKPKKKAAKPKGKAAAADEQKKPKAKRPGGNRRAKAPAAVEPDDSVEESEEEA